MYKKISFTLALILAGAAACSSETAGTTRSDTGSSNGGDGGVADTGQHDGSTGTETKIAAVVTSTVLVTDATDPNVVNAWGLAFGPAGRAWIANNGTGTVSVYDANVKLQETITVPVLMLGATAAPSGLIVNSALSALGNDAFDDDLFIGVTEDGTVVGFTATGNPVIRVDNSENGAVYKGVAIASSGGHPRLITTNFNAGAIEVYDTNYNRILLPQGAFDDATIPAGFVPFNAAAFDDVVVVTYAKQNAAKHDDVKGVGNGYVNAFDANGNMLGRLASQGTLNSPWGLATMSDNAKSLQQRLLVGNFGDGMINVFDVKQSQSGLAANFVGVLGTTSNQPLMIDGLWGIQFPPNAGGFDPKTLYFTAGPNGEQNGAYGRIVFMSETTR